MAVNKLDPKIIFASEAPAQDTPAVFNNRTLGWGESRKNGGRPTIKQMNALQQDTELKILWLNENAVTPFDATIDYPVNAVTIKDGQFKIFNGTSWNLFLDKSSVGLNNVDNTSDLNKPISTAVKAKLDYIDNNGAALPYKEGIAYEENAVVVKDGILQQWKGGVWVLIKPDHNELTGRDAAEAHPASAILDESGLSQQEINDLTGNPIMFGAKGDGVFDDTLAIQECADKFRYLDMRNGNWKTTSKITLRTGTVIDLRGSYLSANNANETIFEFENAGDGLSILGGGGVISGTAGSFLKCTGSTTTPTSASHYARQIRLDGLYIVSLTIDKFLDLKDAVRQVFIDSVHAYTKNGISAIGKCVEVKATKSIIYGSTNEAGTYGIKLQSPAGNSYYNEGFHFTDCTIDNFNTTFDVTDIYVLSVTGGHIGRSQVGDSVVARFGQPISTHCKDIKFTGVNIAGAIVFSPTSGCDYSAQFTGCASEVATGININIRPSAAGIKISDHTFHTSNNGVAVVCANGTTNISVNNISCDTTFIGGVQVLGSDGEGISIDNIQYSGTGNSLYLERPVRLSNVPISDATKDYIQKFNTGSIQGSHIVGANIADVNNWFAKGETGVIVCELTYTGASASQVLTITTPAGMSIPSGTGWSSGAVMLNTVDGRVSLAIPYIVTQDISSGAIVLKNDAGNTISLGYHSYFGFKRDC